MDSDVKMFTAISSVKGQEFLAGQEFICEEIYRTFGVPAYFWDREAMLQRLRELIEELTTTL